MCCFCGYYISEGERKLDVDASFMGVPTNVIVCGECVDRINKMPIEKRAVLAELIKTMPSRKELERP